FSQKSQATPLLPMPNQHLDAVETSPHIDFSEYVWEETPTNILNYLIRIYVQSTIEYALFESLMAESAARFISMDSSTRNAKDVLEELELEYNKTRQAKITRELSELMGSF
ncbi:MAG: FoF1 ATP synthase subunit gamma, partial [Candidatus Babeliales bacterium]